MISLSDEQLITLGYLSIGILSLLIADLKLKIFTGPLDSKSAFITLSALVTGFIGLIFVLYLVLLSNMDEK